MQHIVRTWALARTYRRGSLPVPVLRGINLDLRAGEWVAILGPSGSGKSTLLNLLGLLDQYRRIRRSERLERAAQVLEEVGLGDRMDYDTSELSGGQIQRVAIARALVGDPALLLADEPTGNLDTASGADILDLFGRLHARGRTVLLITHDPVVAGRAQRRLLLDDGRLHPMDHTQN